MMVGSSSMPAGRRKRCGRPSSAASHRRFGDRRSIARNTGSTARNPCRRCGPAGRAFLGEIRKPPRVRAVRRRRARSSSCSGRLAEVEAEIHQVPVEKVHFHELARSTRSSTSSSASRVSRARYPAALCRPGTLSRGEAETARQDPRSGPRHAATPEDSDPLDSSKGNG
jgi:hypothetical protein